MRTRVACLLAAAALVAPGATAPVVAAPVGPGFTSPNVEWLAQIPEVGAIGAKFVTDAKGKATWMYVTGVDGLSIYDVRNPALPILTGALPLPHFENEDVDGNNDIAIVSTDPGGDVHVIDVRNKNAPALKLTIDSTDSGAHTSSCIDGCKRWLYASGGRFLKIIDLRAALSGEGEVVHTFERDQYVGRVHDVDQDAAGIVWLTGSQGGAGYAIRPLGAGYSPRIRHLTRRASAVNPVNVTNMWIDGENIGRSPEVNDFVMHNSKRPTDAVYKQRRGASRIGKGQVFLTTEEDYLPNDTVGGCKGAGRFHTWDATGSLSHGTPLRRLDTFELKEATLDPVKGEKQLGNALCGAHWFTVHRNVVAIGMYGAGTRFLDVSDPRDIKQVGFWFTADQATWGAYWVPGSNGVVYTIDVERGIDVLRFTPPKPGVTYKAPAPVVSKSPRIRFDVRPSSESAWGYACLVATPRAPLA